MTKAKEWPYQAAAARDRSAEEAQSIAGNAAEILDVTENPNILKRVGKILRSANTILRLLEAQGAKTRPIEDRGRRAEDKRSQT